MVNRHVLYKFICEIILQKTIREGLLMALPLLVIGSIALTIRAIPIPAYQNFIQTIADGQVHYILSNLHTYTLTIIPLVLIFTMSFSFGRTVCKNVKEILYYPLTTFCAYLMFLAPHSQLTFLDVFGAMQTFVAIVTTIAACTLLYFLQNWKYTNLQHYLRTHNATFDTAYRMVLPAAIVFLLFAAANLVFSPNIKDIAGNLHMQLFNYLGNNLFSLLVLAFMEHCYWFIGIHGSNVLDVVTTNIMIPRMQENLTALAAGLPATELYTNTFLDMFMNMGGCGSALALIISIFCFAKLPYTRRIAKISALPGLFNISEIIIIGLPVICNGTFLLPFLLVPLLILLISASAIQLGLVPIPSQPIAWTTPIFLSGYMSTGSISGSFLQLFTITIGALIYRPFVQSYERKETQKLKKSLKRLIAEVTYCEKLGKSPSLLSNSEFADVANVLSSDLRQALKNRQLQLFYQPQVNSDGSIYGGEALLRWNHPQLGYIYPPLIIFLATENKFLDELGLYLIDRTCHDLEYLSKNLLQPIKISVNVAPPQLYNQFFCSHIRRLLKKYHFGKSIIAFELTEQIALSSTLDIIARLRELKKMGILLSMDDFGMGHSSVMYLQDSEFDIVKLDGNLTKKVLKSDRSVDIIQAITQLAEKFKFKVVAEYVETEAQRDKLAELGCHIYQGWLYSPAVPLHEFINYIQTTNKNQA